MNLMESQWISIPPAVAQLIVVAMIREGQIELARAEMGRLHEKGVAISDWVYPILIHALCDRGDFEAILDLCYTLFDQGFLIPRPTLLHMLERASSMKDLSLTKYIWHTYVESMHIIPDEAVSMAVLRVAAQHTDHNLAESVAIVLESVTTSTLPMPSEESSVVASNRMPDTPSVEHHAHGATENNASHALPEGSEAPLNKTHIHEIALDLPHDQLEDGRATSEKSTRLRKGPLPASDTTEAVNPSKSGITADRTKPRLLTIPAEAQSILASLRDSYTGRPMYRKNYQLGNLFPVFREDMGLSDARFDPRLALRRRQGWWFQPISKAKKRISSSRRTPPRADRGNPGS